MPTRALYHRYPSQITPQPAYSGASTAVTATFPRDWDLRDRVAAYPLRFGTATFCALPRRRSARIARTNHRLARTVGARHAHFRRVLLLNGTATITWPGTPTTPSRRKTRADRVVRAIQQPDCLGRRGEVGDWLEPSITRHADHLEVGETILPRHRRQNRRAFGASAMADDVVLDGSAADLSGRAARRDRQRRMTTITKAGRAVRLHPRTATPPRRPPAAPRRKVGRGHLQRPHRRQTPLLRPREARAPTRSSAYPPTPPPKLVAAGKP